MPSILPIRQRRANRASTLAALGLATLVLVPWLIYKLQWAQAILIGVMLFARRAAD